jgi:hypothetical protein
MTFRTLIALWGVIGITYSLGKAIYRMTPRVIDGLSMTLTPLQWGALIGFCFFMLYFEGYKGFQKKYSPRTAARVKYLRDHPNWLRDFLAPLFCMGYFHANRKTKIKAYVLTIGVAGLVWAVKHCDQPWRGIVDLGVILGLSWGLVAFWIFSYQALTSENFTHSPETPE